MGGESEKTHGCHGGRNSSASRSKERPQSIILDSPGWGAIRATAGGAINCPPHTSTGLSCASRRRIFCESASLSNGRTTPCQACTGCTAVITGRASMKFTRVTSPGMGTDANCGKDGKAGWPASPQGRFVGLFTPTPSGSAPERCGRAECSVWSARRSAAARANCLGGNHRPQFSRTDGHRVRLRSA